VGEGRFPFPCTHTLRTAFRASSLQRSFLLARPLQAETVIDPTEFPDTYIPGSSHKAIGFRFPGMHDSRE